MNQDIDEEPPIIKPRELETPKTEPPVLPEKIEVVDDDVNETDIQSKVPDEIEALEMANASRFAFAGGIFTRDIARAIRFARRVKAGRLWVNTYRVTSAQVPFGAPKTVATDASRDSML